MAHDPRVDGLPERVGDIGSSVQQLRDIVQALIDHLDPYYASEELNALRMRLDAIDG